MSILISSNPVILAGDSEQALVQAALHAAAACQCGSENPPCLICSGCRKTLEGVHPDVIWLSLPREKDISVDRVRELRADVFVRPFEGKKKVYCIERAHKLTVAAQNALLKLLEEPPEYAAFLLLTDNAQALLPTLRSRCALERLPAPAAPEPPDPEAIGRARALFGALVARDELGFTRVLYGWDKLTRDALRGTLEAFTVCLRDGLLAGEPVSISMLDAAVSAMDSLEYNAGIGVCCGALAARLARALE